MGFSILFCLIVIFLFGISVILLLLLAIFKKRIFGRILGAIWLTIIIAIILLSFLNFLFSKTKIEQNDLYGDYVIDKSMFKGEQSEWQYEHYKFTLTKENKMFFYILENGKIIKTIKGNVEYTKFYESPRLILNFTEPKFHILEENPTLYRSNWSYYYVFYSPKYGNVFFKKANWLGN